MQIPVLSGIYSDKDSDFRVSYPRNRVPVILPQGISNGYLRPAEGILEKITGPGIDKGGIDWNGVHYRVMGTKLVKIESDNTLTEIGTVAAGDYARFNYSFDRLSVSIGGALYYWDDTTFQQVTDPDLGFVVDHTWVDGYFMSTDGEFIVVTDIADPLAVDPLKYASSEADPDPIEALLKIKNEVYAINRHTIEVFDNVGGAGFPFQRIDGAQIMKGCVGTRACCVYNESLAFVGSGRGEALAIYIVINGSAQKLSTREIDIIINEYTETQLAASLMEYREEGGHSFLYLHLPDKTLVYDAIVSREAGSPVWHILTSGTDIQGQYLARNFVYVYGDWHVGHPTLSKIGYMTKTVTTQWGNRSTWEFSTQILYNGGKGAVVNELELVGLTGRSNVTDDPLIYTQYSLDGLTFSQPRYIKAGKVGETTKRLIWFSQGTMRNWRIQRFHGDSDANISIARLEAQIEPMAY